MGFNFEHGAGRDQAMMKTGLSVVKRSGQVGVGVCDRVDWITDARRQLVGGIHARTLGKHIQHRGIRGDSIQIYWLLFVLDRIETRNRNASKL